MELAHVLDQQHQRVVCPVCLDVLSSAVVTNCGHSFCQTCIDAALAAQSAYRPLCPVCRARVTGTVPDFLVRSLVQDLHAAQQAKPLPVPPLPESPKQAARLIQQRVQQARDRAAQGTWPRLLHLRRASALHLFPAGPAVEPDERLPLRDLHKHIAAVNSLLRHHVPAPGAATLAALALATPLCCAAPLWLHTRHAAALASIGAFLDVLNRDTYHALGVHWSLGSALAVGTADDAAVVSNRVHGSVLQALAPAPTSLIIELRAPPVDLSPHVRRLADIVRDLVRSNDDLRQANAALNLAVQNTSRPRLATRMRERMRAAAADGDAAGKAKGKGKQAVRGKSSKKKQGKSKAASSFVDWLTSTLGLTSDDLPSDRDSDDGEYDGSRADGNGAALGHRLTSSNPRPVLSSLPVATRATATAAASGDAPDDAARSALDVVEVSSRPPASGSSPSAARAALVASDAALAAALAQQEQRDAGIDDDTALDAALALSLAEVANSPMPAPRSPARSPAPRPTSPPPPPQSQLYAARESGIMRFPVPLDARRGMRRQTRTRSSSSSARTPPPS